MRLAPIVLANSSTPHLDSAGLGYLPPRSNGLIGGRSFMIAHNLESVSGSRLLCPAGNKVIYLVVANGAQSPHEGFRLV